LTLALDSLFDDLERRVFHARDTLDGLDYDGTLDAFVDLLRTDVEGLVEAFRAARYIEAKQPMTDAERLGALRRISEEMTWSIQPRLSSLLHVTPEDIAMSRTVADLATECSIAARPLVMCSMLDGSFWTRPDLDLITVAVGEHDRLLALPDVVHELCHGLYREVAGACHGNMATRVRKHMLDAVKAKTLTQAQGTRLIRAWNRWDEEFCCDLLATYLCGPAYGWQNVLLGAHSPQPGWEPQEVSIEKHPPDDARAYAISSMLELTGHQAQARSQLGALADLADWANDDPPPADHDWLLPYDLIDALAQRVKVWAEHRGMSGFDEKVGRIRGAVHEAWACLLERPAEFDADHAVLLGVLAN
jgi:hypothetical protein